MGLHVDILKPSVKRFSEDLDPSTTEQIHAAVIIAIELQELQVNWNTGSEENRTCM
jgi:hypothetical protein